MKKLIAATALVAMLALAVPAFGGPSPLRIAKKALKTAKAAKKTADKNVNRTVTRSSGEVPAAPIDFAEFDVKCPAGYTPTGPSMGLGALEPVSVLAVPRGYIGSYFNPSDQSVFSGSLEVICLKGSWAGGSVATHSKAEALRQLHAAERARLAR